MSIFSQVADVTILKTDRLLKVAADYFPDAMPSDDLLWMTLQAEEMLLEQRMRTCFAVREVLPSGADPSEFAAFAASNTPVIEEPGYDYDPRFFNGDSWGLLHLRHKPIVAVHSIVFAYPNVSNVLMTIPSSWIRPEKKYGSINIVPGTDTAINLPANAYILSALGGGRVIPFMIQVRYSAGIPNARTTRPDIVDLIFKLTVISVLENNFFPTSGSSSLDGLSQSLSVDTGKYREMTDKREATLRSSLNGLVFGVM